MTGITEGPIRSPTDRLPTLLLALKDDHVSVVWNAARELAKLGAAADSALPALTEALRSRDATSALWARFAVAIITNDRAKHLPVFIATLDDKRVFPGMAAAALAGLGAAARPAVPALIPQMQSEKADNRWGAAWAIANIAQALAEDAGAGGNSANEATDEMLRGAVLPLAKVLTTDADEKARWYAAYALSEIGEGAADALPALVSALNDFDEDVRGYAARALGRIGPMAITALPALAALRDDDENENVQREAAAAVIAIWS